MKTSQNTSEKAPLCIPQSEYLDKPSVLKQYTDVIKGIGMFPDECMIHIDPSVIPVVHLHVEFHLQRVVNSSWNLIVWKRLITKVSTPTEWVNSLVVVEKPQSNKLRICLDPKDLNKAILRLSYPDPFCRIMIKTKS